MIVGASFGATTLGMGCSFCSRIAPPRASKSRKGAGVSPRCVPGSVRCAAPLIPTHHFQRVLLAGESVGLPIGSAGRTGESHASTSATPGSCNSRYRRRRVTAQSLEPRGESTTMVMAHVRRASGTGELPVRDHLVQLGQGVAPIRQWRAPRSSNPQPRLESRCVSAREQAEPRVKRGSRDRKEGPRTRRGAWVALAMPFPEDSEVGGPISGEAPSPEASSTKSYKRPSPRVEMKVMVPSSAATTHADIRAARLAAKENRNEGSTS